MDRLSEKIQHLFLIAAFVAQEGQSLLDIAIAGGPSEIPNVLIMDSDGKTQSLNLQKIKQAFYHDCSSAIADWAIGQLQPQPIAPITTPIHWKDSGKYSHKRTYLICEHDRDVHPTTQRKILSHYPCHTISLQTGHFPLCPNLKLLLKFCAFKIQ